MTCIGCKSPLAEGQRFCSACGIAQQKNCPSCGASVPPHAKFCASCGHSLRDTGPLPAKAGTGPLPAKAGTGPLPDAAPPGDRRVVTVLFTDVSGFTAMSEKLDPEEVTDVINAFFKVLTEPIYQYGGVVDKYIGDAIMALFGAPVAHEDDPARALMAAYEMQKAAKIFADRLEATTSIRLKVRIGLNTGLVVAGAVGGQRRQDYTVMGDTVNLAQRMESSAPVGGILVTQETFRLTKELFEFSIAEVVTVKGKAAPIQTYEVLRLRPQKILAVRRMVALFGRGLEMERLRLTFEAARHGEPQFVEVVGEAGTGKSRLLHDACADEGVSALTAHSQSFNQHIAYSTVGNLLEAWLELKVERTPEQAQGRLREAVAAVSPAGDLDRRVALLAHLLRQETAHPEVEALTPQQKRTAAFLVLSDLLFDVARRSPPLVVRLDDLQWADEASLEWLETFLERIQAMIEGTSLTARVHTEPVPVAIVISFRPEFRHKLPSTEKLNHQRLAIRALDAMDSTRLLGALFELPEGLAAWSPPLRSLSNQIMGRAEGNPYFLEELVAGLVEAGVLIKATGGWTVAQAAEITLPPTVNGVVASRLDRLSLPLKSTLQVAAVLGRTFSEEMVLRLKPGEEDEQRLDQLARAGFVVRSAPGEWSFVQAVVQEVAYASLLISVRKALHQTAALALEAANVTGPEPLARHWTLAGDKGKAAWYLKRCGDQARQTYSNQEALGDYRKALLFLDDLEEVPDEPRRPTLLKALAEAEITAGEAEAALAHLDAALALADSPVEQAGILEARGGAWERLGAFPSALSQYEEALALLDRGKHTVEASRVLIDTAFLHFRLGDQMQCIGFCKEALDLLAEADQSHEKAMAHSILGLCLFQQSRFGEASQHHQYALHLREQAQDWFGVASSRNNLGLIASYTAAWAEAVEHFSEALELFARVGDLGKVSLVQGNLGFLLCRQGDLQGARSRLEQALDIHERLKNQFGVGSTLAMLGLVRIEAGEPAVALELLEQALGGFEATGAAEQLAEIHQLRGRAYLDVGRLEEAAESLARALELSVQSGEKLQEGVTYAHMARLDRLRGDATSAEVRVSKALEMIEATGSRHEFGRALVEAAEIRSASGRQAEAEAAIGQAREIFETLGAQLDLSRLGVPA